MAFQISTPRSRIEFVELSQFVLLFTEGGNEGKGLCALRAFWNTKLIP